MKRFALVIDDNRETADSLVMMLDLLGYQAKVAYGALTAITKFTQRFPDVILLDIHMAGMNGVEVCRFIRRDPRTAHLPVLAMSSDNQPALIASVREAGANGFLAKPISLDALEQVLHELEKEMDGGAGAAPTPP
jgi:CheY-like chemotaxis protein